MNLTECLLVIIGLSLHIFLVAEYEGTMLRQIHIGKLICVCGIFFVWQIAAMSVGYLITMIPLFRQSSQDLKILCYVLVVIIFLGEAVYMLRKAWKREVIQERLSEIRYKHIFMEAALIGCFTFLAGIGCGFLGIHLVTTCAIMACATILAVIAGIFMGYHQGCRFRSGIYGVGGILFLITGVDVITRHLM